MKRNFGRLVVVNLVSIFIFITLILPQRVDSAVRQNSLLTPGNSINSIHVPFLKNNGQIQDKNVHYYSRTFGGPAYITNKGEIVYCLLKKNTSADSSIIVLKERFGDKKQIIPKALERSDVKVKFYYGNTTSKWNENYDVFGAIGLGEISPGIELKVRSRAKNIEKIFYISPNVDPSKLTVKVDGAIDLKVNSNGELLIHTDGGVIGFSKPIAYQEIEGVRSSVPVKYITNKCEYGFNLGKYDKNYALIIDPLLSSTFLGGGTYDDGRSVCTDSNGNVFVVGVTKSVDFPTTPGVYKTSNSGSEDIFISKFDSDLKTLLAATYFGGSNDDFGLSIKIDSNDNIIIAGSSSSEDFPITPGTFTPNPVPSGSEERMFVAKFDNALQNLLASTAIGTVGSQKGYSGILTLDANDNIIIAGSHPSSGFSTDTSIESYWIDYHGFVAKLNSSLTVLLSAKTIVETIYSLGIDNTRNVFIAGTSDGQNSTEDVYVAKLDSNMQNLLSEKVFGGGNGADYATGLAIDDDNNVYVAGDTRSSDFPVTSNVFDTTYNDDGDIFFAKLDPELKNILIATFIGTENMMGSEGITLIQFNEEGDLCGVGFNHSKNWPTTQNAFQPEGGGHTRGFIIKFDKNLQTLLYSTYFGGDDGHDYINSISIVPAGYVYVAGRTGSSNFPVTSGAYDEIYNLDGDAFIAKVKPDTSTITGVFDITGTWNFSDTEIWDDCDPNTALESGTAAVTQSGDNITMVIDGKKFNGKINGLTASLSGSYSENGGNVTQNITVSLSSGTFGTGNSTWSWTDGNTACDGGSNFTFEKATTSGGDGGDGDGGGDGCFITTMKP